MWKAYQEQSRGDAFFCGVIIYHGNRLNIHEVLVEVSTSLHPLSAELSGCLRGKELP